MLCISCADEQSNNIGNKKLGFDEQQLHFIMAVWENGYQQGKNAVLTNWANDPRSVRSDELRHMKDSLAIVKFIRR